MTADSNLRLEFHHRRLSSVDEEHREELERSVQRRTRRLEELDRTGRIADFETRTHSAGTPIERDPTRGGDRKRKTDLFDASRRWARHHNLNTYFREEDDYIKFPEMFLIVREANSHEYTGVFPCADSQRKYGIDTYLDALEVGEDWREWSPKAELEHPDDGEHGAIKLELVDRPAGTVGEEWRFYGDEVSVAHGSASDSAGRIDLVFHHEDDDSMRLFVEVKPNRESVDEAFGQLLRYRYQYLAHRTATPAITDDDIELAIAAPRFYEAHRQGANEVGIGLIEVSR